MGPIVPVDHWHSIFSDILKAALHNICISMMDKMIICNVNGRL